MFFNVFLFSLKGYSETLRILCTQIYQTINNLNANFMKDLFSLKETSRLVREKYMLNLNIPVHNQVSFGSKSLRVFGPKVWKSLPYHIKSFENLESFKMTIKHWNGTRCNCKVCNTHKIHKNRDSLSKANLGLLKHPGCTTLG